MLCLVTVWGVNFVLLKFATTQMSPLGFNGLRFGLGTLIMLTLWGFTERHVRIARRDWPAIIALGIIGNTGYQLFFIYAIKFSSPANIALIVATSPVWVALFSALLKNDRLTWRSWLGILISISGLYVIITAGGRNIALGGETLWGDLLMVGGVAAWALYSVLARPLLKRYSATTFTTWTMFAGAPPVLLLGIPELLHTNFAAIAGSAWLILIFSATFAIAIGYIIWNAGVHQLGQARTAIYNNLVPVVALAVSAIFLNDPITPDKLIGAAIVLLGVTLARRG